MSAFTPSAEIAFVQLDRALENLIGSQGQMIVDNHADFTVEQCCRIGMDTQNIGGRTGGNFQHKKNGAVLSVLFSLICSALSSYFEGNISANLVQPQKLTHHFITNEQNKTYAHSQNPPPYNNGFRGLPRVRAFVRLQYSGSDFIIRAVLVERRGR